MSRPNPLLEKARALRLSKHLSQNFLIDSAALSTIATAVKSDPPLPIIEIGAGAGFLTRLLVDSGHPVTAIEVDPRMVALLRTDYAEFSAVNIIEANVLDVYLAKVFPEKVVVVGNLPYHLTGPILFQILGELTDEAHDLRPKLDKVVVMVQQEVADRLIAQPGDSAYSQLTLQAQFWFTAKIILRISRQSFYPAPKVDSAVVMLTPRPAPAIAVSNLKHLGRLIKMSFKHRRKTLMNNLKLGNYGTMDTLLPLFTRFNLPLECRPQEVSLRQYGALSDALVALETDG